MIKVLLIALIAFTSCSTASEKYLRKREAAKQKIASLAKQYDLNKSVDTIIITGDTIVRDRLVEIRDTVYTPGVSFIKTFSNIIGTHVFNDSSHTIEGIVTITNDDVAINIYKKPEMLILKDTVLVHDTLTVERVVTKHVEIINPQPNVFLAIWGTLKSFLWIIIVIILIMLFLKLIL